MSLCWLVHFDWKSLQRTLLYRDWFQHKALESDIILNQLPPAYCSGGWDLAQRTVAIFQFRNACWQPNISWSFSWFLCFLTYSSNSPATGLFGGLGWRELCPVEQDIWQITGHKWKCLRTEKDEAQRAFIASVLICSHAMPFLYKGNKIWYFQ